MATLNLNSVLCNVSINDVVVIARMGIGSQLAGKQASAIPSQGWPVPTGPRPTNAVMWAALAMKKSYRDATRERTGRSAVSPTAGFLEHPCHGSDFTSRAAISTRWHRFLATATNRPAAGYRLQAETRQSRRSLAGRSLAKK